MMIYKDLGWPTAIYDEKFGREYYEISDEIEVYDFVAFSLWVPLGALGCTYITIYNLNGYMSTVNMSSDPMCTILLSQLKGSYVGGFEYKLGGGWDVYSKNNAGSPQYMGRWTYNFDKYAQVIPLKPYWDAMKFEHVGAPMPIRPRIGVERSTDIIGLLDNGYMYLLNYIYKIYDATYTPIYSHEYYYLHIVHCIFTLFVFMIFHRIFIRSYYYKHKFFNNIGHMSALFSGFSYSKIISYGIIFKNLPIRYGHGYLNLFNVFNINDVNIKKKKRGNKRKDKKLNDTNIKKKN